MRHFTSSWRFTSSSAKRSGLRNSGRSRTWGSLCKNGDRSGLRPTLVRGVPAGQSSEKRPRTAPPARLHVQTAQPPDPPLDVSDADRRHDRDWMRDSPQAFSTSLLHFAFGLKASPAPPITGHTRQYPVAGLAAPPAAALLREEPDQGAAGPPRFPRFARRSIAWGVEVALGRVARDPSAPASAVPMSRD